MNQETLIEKFFEHQLSDQEQEHFSKLLLNDPDFAAEVAFLQQVGTAAEQKEEQRLKKELQQVEVQWWNRRVSQKKYLKWAGIAALILLFIIPFTKNKTEDVKALFQSYYSPAVNVTFPIERSEATATKITNAFTAYEMGDYEKALVEFSTISDLKGQQQLLYYEANALLALGRTEAAIEKFKQHLTHTDVLTNRSHWYLALAYIKKKDSKNAKQELRALLNSGEAFKKVEASSLLKKLE